MIRWLTWASALLLFASVPGAAQRWPDDQCVDNPNLAPCLQSRADGLAEIYGVRRVEAHRDAGDEVVRVFYEKDGFRALIALVRAPGRDPVVSVHFRSAGNPPAAIQALIPQAVWSEALSRSAYADRSLVAVPEDAENQAICLHPWNYIFEASEPADAIYGRNARIRRHSASGCDDAPLLYLAADLQRLVLPLFPACDALDRNRYGNAVLRLIQCQRLSGDRLAAAEVMNLASAFERIGEPEGPSTLDDLFAWNAAIDWNGRRHAPNEREPEAFWRARIAEDNVRSFHMEAAFGQSRSRVRVTGYLFRDQPGTDDGTQSRARFEQIWNSTVSGIQVTSITVGPWQTYRPR